MPSAVIPIIAGHIGAAWTDAGICTLTLPQATPQQALALLPPRHARASPADPLLLDLTQRLQRYFSGDPVGFDDLPLDLSGVSPFRRAVLETVRRIPRGHVRPYRDIAIALGKPGAARAVGGAMANNPVCIIVPCHRVIASDGRLGGFGGGLDMKQRLLDRERRAPALAQASA
ncbi:MAG: methylated-DNA--[protein]-cysteine S-methyltransferase [Dehalococcoidia bacterium]|nr:methylated-DNA--[protein]-cysteine S-methyltransferase [Dehalococcoidia bacterium]